MEEAKYSVFSISNWLIEHNATVKGAFPMTVMRLMKLAYFAQGWFLAIRNKPLFYDKIEARRYGPVIPALYDRYKVYGLSTIPQTRIVHLDDESNPSLSAEDERFLREVYERYSDMDTYALSRLTHDRKGPWFKTINHHMTRVIRPTLIQEYYKDVDARERSK